MSTDNKDTRVGFTAKEQRVIVRYLFHMKERPAEIHKLLDSVCGEAAAPYKLVKQWIYDDSKGQEDVEEQNKNAYSTATNGAVSVKQNIPTDPALVYRMEYLVNHDRRITIDKASEMTMVTTQTAQHVLCDVLGLKKVNERWVPRLWTPEQRAYRVTVCNELLDRYQKEGDEFLDRIIVGDEEVVFYYTPDKLRRVSTSMFQGVLGVGEKYRPSIEQDRVRIMIFYDRRGILLAEEVPEGIGFEGEAYANILKNHLAKAYAQKRKGKPISDCLILHDNTAEHYSKPAQTALKELGMEQLSHPPASPDIEPHEYWLIPFIKNHMRGGGTQDRHSVLNAVTHHLKKCIEEDFKKSIYGLPSRWAQCTDTSGLYVL